MQIYPSILETNGVSLIAQLNKLLPIFSHCQIDIGDGIFVQTRTVQLDEIISLFEQNPKIVTVPIEQKTFEFHLMVENFEQEFSKIDQLKKYINVLTVFIHLQPLARHQYAIPNTNFKLGLSLNPEDTIADNIKAIQLFDMIQLMTVQPGLQGQPFLPEVLTKIEELRNAGYDGKIILDGAMNDQTLARVLQQKELPDAICPGSYLGQNDPQEALRKLDELIGEKFL